MTDAAYYRAWRAAHPGYRKRQNEVKRARRARMTAEERRRDRGTRASRALPPMPLLHTGHELFDRAREIAGNPRSGLTILHDPLHEDLLSEAVVALLEGADPREAVRRYRANESAWRRITGPLLLEGVAA